MLKVFGFPLQFQLSLVVFSPLSQFFDLTKLKKKKSLITFEFEYLKDMFFKKRKCSWNYTISELQGKNTLSRIITS
jgi:hypothetical protein